MEKEVKKKYQRFIMEATNFIYKNRAKGRGKYFNIYVDSGEFWFELEGTTFVDIYDRKLVPNRVFDPVFHISGSQIVDLMEMKPEEIPEEELEDYRMIYKEKIEELLKEEIPFDLFEKWLD
ncbi:MAG: hypothetical protein D6732_15365 [Methanobacteriota archaeon]|nr:MAG: hypothetical protein D6732_15365 [Euryarchaeota archaeon]